MCLTGDWSGRQLDVAPPGDRQLTGMSLNCMRKLLKAVWVPSSIEGLPRGPAVGHPQRLPTCSS